MLIYCDVDFKIQQTSIEKHEHKEETEQKVTWWQQHKCRCTGLIIFLLLILGAVIGLVLGLNNDEAVAVAIITDDTITITPSAAPSSMPSAIDDIVLAPIPLVVDRTCEYTLTQTVYVGVTDNGIDNRMR